MLAERLLRLSEQEQAGASDEELDILRRLKACFSRHREIEGHLLHPLMLIRCENCWTCLKEATRENRCIDGALDGLIDQLARGEVKPVPRQDFRNLDRQLRRHLFHEEDDAFSRAKEGVPAGELMRLGEEAEHLTAAP